MSIDIYNHNRLYRLYLNKKGAFPFELWAKSLFTDKEKIIIDFEDQCYKKWTKQDFIDAEQAFLLAYKNAYMRECPEFVSLWIFKNNLATSNVNVITTYLKSDATDKKIILDYYERKNGIDFFSFIKENLKNKEGKSTSQLYFLENLPLPCWSPEFQEQFIPVIASELKSQEKIALWLDHPFHEELISSKNKSTFKFGYYLNLVNGIAPEKSKSISDFYVNEFIDSFVLNKNQNKYLESNLDWNELFKSTSETSLVISESFFNKIKTSISFLADIISNKTIAKFVLNICGYSFDKVMIDLYYKYHSDLLIDFIGAVNAYDSLPRHKICGLLLLNIDITTDNFIYNFRHEISDNFNILGTVHLFNENDQKIILNRFLSFVNLDLITNNIHDFYAVNFHDTSLRLDLFFKKISDGLTFDQFSLMDMLQFIEIIHIINIEHTDLNKFIIEKMQTYAIANKLFTIKNVEKEIPDYTHEKSLNNLGFYRFLKTIDMTGYERIINHFNKMRNLLPEDCQNSEFYLNNYIKQNFKEFNIIINDNNENLNLGL